MTDPRAAAAADLTSALRRLAQLISMPGNSFDWSSWIGPDQAVAEIESLVADVGAGDIDTMRISYLFAPTGPAQSVAVSSGWSEHFLELAGHVDPAIALLAHADRSGVQRRAEFLCSSCGNVAGRIDIDTAAGAGTVTRASFTGELQVALGPPGAALLRTALAELDPAAVFALDPELAPWFCPLCRENYCGAHWRAAERDEEQRGAIRGRCPAGHERTLAG